MTKLLEEAFQALERMPIDAQDSLARALLGIAEAGALNDIEPEHLEAVMDGMVQAERGAFAARGASEIVAAAFRHDR